MSAHSYRADPAVPVFDDSRPVAVVDGDCALFSLGARMIARHDRRAGIRICPCSTPLGAALMLHYGLDPEAPESWLYLSGGRAYRSLDGVIEAGRAIGGAGHLLRPLRILPRGLRHRLYLAIARNRYRMFGRGDLCALPEPGLRARLIG